MRVVQCSRSVLPIRGYGGTERCIFWTAEALADLGHRVYLIAGRGSRSAKATIIALPRGQRDLNDLIPDDADIIHLHGTPDWRPKKPFLVTIDGNGKPGERFLPTTVFVSQNHAQRHGSQHFVYNGVEPSEYHFREQKEDYFLFLSRAKLKTKGVDLAISLARRAGAKLLIAGGWRLSVSPSVRWVGEVWGSKKAELLAGAKALLFPIRWEEPFGLVVIEALVSGTPVITTSRGAMPELVTPDVGFVCRNEEEMLEAMRRVGELHPQNCRARVLETFTARKMAEGYLRYYRMVLETGGLA
jgi:glycosyltransferase involved in cell wall biosynthesis